MKKLFLLPLVISSLFFSVSCNKDDDSIEEIPIEEPDDQSIDRYLGAFAPISSTAVAPGLTEYTFSGENGPICYTGNEFSMFTRDGSSNNLLIFLQGGGFCSPVSCEAVEDIIPLVPFGILNPADPENPAANFDVGYVPYCDGSGMMGDNEVDSDGDGVNDRFFRGVQNLSASLDVIAQNYPSPEKIVLAGNSAGGFAVHAALPLVRKLYPNVRIDVINDSGVGILNPGAMQSLIDYWNAGAFFPSSCTDCIGADGNLTDYHKNQLTEDPNARLAYISSKQDATFAALIQGGGPAFETELIEAAEELKAAFPDRFNALIANGEDHTFLISDFTFQVGNTSVRSWVSDMINETAEWAQVIEGSTSTETGTFDRTFSHNSITREYQLYIPTSYAEDGEVPLVVYLHGAGENKEFAPRTTDLVEVAEEEGFVLVFAEASFELQDQGVFVWADGRGAIGGAVDASLDDVGFVNALVDAITDEFAINPSKRYLCGFSNGGSLTQRMAIQANERFAAMATVAAGLHEPYATENPGRAIPMLFIHGTDDPLASYEEGGITGENQLMFTVGLLNVEESVGYWVTNNQCDATPLETDLANTNTFDNSTVTKFEYTGGTNGAAVTLYRINGGGHTWPGVTNGALRQPQIFGQTNEDVKAGREIWDFFKRFEIN